MRGQTAVPWLSTTSAAAYLSITPRTLATYARRGLLPSYRLGRSWRFRQQDLDALLTSETCQSDTSVDDFINDQVGGAP